VESCQVHLTEKKALVTGEFALDHVRKAIEDAGYRTRE